MGSVGGFIFYLKCIVHGPSAGNFITVLFKGSTLGLCYSLNYNHSEAYRGKYVTFDLLA